MEAIRVDAETANMLREMSDKTGQTIGSIASRITLNAYLHFVSGVMAGIKAANELSQKKL